MRWKKRSYLASCDRFGGRRFSLVLELLSSNPSWRIAMQTAFLQLLSMFEGECSIIKWATTASFQSNFLT
jgi:hypothetical protein